MPEGIVGWFQATEITFPFQILKGNNLLRGQPLGKILILQPQILFGNMWVINNLYILIYTWEHIL